MKFLLPLTLIILLSCSSEKEGFSLKGFVQGIPDSTEILLDDIDGHGPIDTTLVINNSFQFNTSFDSFPRKVVIRLSDYSQYRFLWLEDNPMTFNAVEERSFRFAPVEGSNLELVEMKTFDKEYHLRSWADQLELSKKFVKENPNSIISASTLSVYKTTWDYETVDDLYNAFSEENKNSIYGKRILKFLSLNKNINVGDQYVDFSMKDQENKNRSLSEVSSDVILLEFWASWCGPCREENPNLVETYKEFKDKGFEIFAVSLDADKENWLNAIEEDILPWIHVSELNGDENSAALIYGLNGIPDNFLINKNGQIIGRNLRGEELYTALSELLN